MILDLSIKIIQIYNNTTYFPAKKNLMRNRVDLMLFNKLKLTSIASHNPIIHHKHCYLGQ